MSKFIDPKMGLHNPTTVSVLSTSVCTAGILLAACGVGVDMAIVSAQRNRTQGMSQPAAIATCETGSRRT
jgi:hypothetical protein